MTIKKIWANKVRESIRCRAGPFLLHRCLSIRDRLCRLLTPSSPHSTFTWYGALSREFMLVLLFFLSASIYGLSFNVFVLSNSVTGPILFIIKVTFLYLIPVVSADFFYTPHARTQQSQQSTTLCASPYTIPTEPVAISFPRKF